MKKRPLFQNQFKNVANQMSVRSHVVVAGVDDRLRPHPDLEHGGTQDVAGVVRLDLKLVVNFRHLGRDQAC